MRILGIGITGNQSQIEQFRIKLCNYFLWSILVVCIIYAGLYMSYEKYTYSLPYFMTLASAVFGLVLNYHQKFLLNRIFTLLISNVLIFYTLLLAGYDIQAQMFFIIITATSFLLFQGVLIPIINLILVCVTHIFVYAYLAEHGPMNVGSRLNIGEYINFIMAMISAALLSYFMYVELQWYRKKNKRILKEIKKSNALLNLKNEQLEQMIYITSHDLQEPLKNIKNMVSLINKTIETDKQPRAEKPLTYLNQATDRMSNMIRSAMDYSKIGNSRELQIVDCNEVLLKVHSFLKVQLQETGGEMLIQPLPTIKAIPSEIYSLFQNMLSNALKFRHEDRKPVISIDCEKKGNHYVFSCSDNGIGIDAKHTETVFQMFKRLHNQSEYEGTGIGLAHCKKVVELHDGHIWFESNHPHGTTFFFSIRDFQMETMEAVTTT